MKGTHLLACGFILLATLLAIVCFYEVVICASPVEVWITNWFSSELLKVEWIFYFDSLSITMITIVLIVSTAVHVYSVDYIGSDPLLGGIKLSNSGDTLKLIVPNYYGNIVSGWSNYSGMVISYKINESAMGNRGSKSEI